MSCFRENIATELYILECSILFPFLFLFPFLSDIDFSVLEILLVTGIGK